MKLFIDCEFNDYRGELISVGIVDEDGRQFYRVLHCHQPTEWVAEHVIPVLDRHWVGQYELRLHLQEWLSAYDSIHVIADWPDDIKYFCELLITGPGERINTPPITMEIRRDIDSTASAIPHNALEDAKAIRAAYLSVEQGSRA